MGETKESPRTNFFYVSDDGEILAIRMGDWKVVLMEQRAKTLQCWFEHLLGLDHLSRLHHVCGAGVVAQQNDAFTKFPPRQSASFNLNALMEQLQEASSGKGH